MGRKKREEKSGWEKSIYSPGGGTRDDNTAQKGKHDAKIRINP